MTNQVIPAEAVEAALRALGVGHYGITRTQIEIALEAAAPYMLADHVNDEDPDRLLLDVQERFGTT